LIELGGEMSSQHSITPFPAGRAVYVLNEEEIGLFSDEVVVNCAP